MLRLSLFCGVAVLSAMTASAGNWYTQYATIDRGTDGSVNNIQTLTGNSTGRIYSNTISTASPGQNVGDTARVVLIGANLFGSNSYNASTASAPFTYAGSYSGNDVTTVFAVEGWATVISTSGGLPITNFVADSGRLGFFQQTPGGFSPTSPVTWGATSADGSSLLQPLDVYDLVSPGAAVGPGLIDGIPDPSSSFNVAAASMNVASINLANPTDIQGNFLFSETTTFGATITDLITNNQPTPAGATGEEGIVGRTDSALDTSPLLTDVGMGDSGTFLAALNTIATALGGLTNAAGGFATNVLSDANSNVATDYNVLTGNFTTTGDFRETNANTISPVAEGNVPEPASLAVWALGLVGGGIGIRRRRLNKKK